MSEGRIFISYRRGRDGHPGDSHATGWIHDRLGRSFDRDQLFMDVDSIPPGVDFVDYLDRQVGQCRAFLSVVGPGWIDAMDRLHDPNDFVRIEIEAALKRPEIPIIPVLLDDTKMPRADDLPEALHPFVRRNGIVVPRDYLPTIVDGKLTKALRTALDPPESVEPQDTTAPPPSEAAVRAKPIQTGDGHPLKPETKSARRWGWIGIAVPMIFGAAFLYDRWHREPLSGPEPELALKIWSGSSQALQAEPTDVAAFVRPGLTDVPGFTFGVSKVTLPRLELGAVEPAKAVELLRYREKVLTSLASATRTPLANLRPGDSFWDCPTCPEMVVIPAGTFRMGSPPDEEGRRNHEGPQRDVTVPGFAMARTEVTFDQWQVCVDDGGCTSNKKPGDGGWGRGSRPVINVSWNDAQEYVAWLNRQVKGARYRLPSEAEWEYAARAGTTGRFSNDQGPEALCEIANHADVSTDLDWANKTCSDGVGKMTAPVASYAANGFGVYDMHGNVWEWVADVYGGYADAPSDGSAHRPKPLSKDPARWGSRVLRGGSWAGGPYVLRSASRASIVPDDRDDFIGFRPVRTLLTP